jgi:hypothetical protein
MISNGLSSLALLILAGASVVAACSSGSDSHPAPISTGGSSDTSDGGAAGSHRLPTGSGGSSGTAGAESNSAGAAGEEASGGAGGEGGALPPGTIVVVTPAACSEMPAWIGPTTLNGISTGAIESLLSITADELDIAFLRGGALYLAHRDAAAMDFADASAVTVPAGYDPSVGAALSGDGKTLVLVASNGQGFGALSRDSRTTAFGASADTTAFLALNARSQQTLEQYAAPVLAPNGSSFIFAASTTQGTGAVVYESLLTDGVWDMPTNISMEAGFDGGPWLPTALSADSRTLFYFDKGANEEIARFRDRGEPNAPFYDKVALPGLQGAAPNAKCDRVYYSSAGNVLTEAD